MSDRLNTALEKYLPEQRLFLRSETSTTRYLRLRPLNQALMLGGGAAFFAWSLLASAVMLTQVISSGELREQAQREQAYLEARLDQLAHERDRAVDEAQMAHTRYGEAMDRVAAMQSALLTGEQRRAELETGIDGLQRALRERMRERDEARGRLAAFESTDTSEQLARTEARLSEVQQTLDRVMNALTTTAAERETMRAVADTTQLQAEHLALELRLTEDRNQRIFSQLEQAVETSMMPLERMFRSAGLQPEQLLRQVRAGYQTRSAALAPISISTSGTLDPDSDEARANGVLEALSELNLYRIAAQRTPFAMPVRASVRQTSSFGTRRDPRTGRQRMHNGVDWAGPQGTPILATGNGRVSFAGRRGGYGNLVIIEHDFGLETYYAHLHTINVNVGQRVSRGDRIGGMGTTGRSTGVHLHYEIRVGGRPINPMTYIRAAQNVF
ncbi:MAG: peptidoglycan DD-metalloendopeptidase family protein [Pararhodobacter sp.]|nr:peptidoglycan DD-metalloendopeptidase family protein [Pararhodobacter sp.]